MMQPRIPKRDLNKQARKGDNYLRYIMENVELDVKKLLAK